MQFYTLRECGVALLPESHGAIGQPQSPLREQQHLCVQAEFRSYRVTHLDRQTGYNCKREIEQSLNDFSLNYYYYFFGT